MVSSERGRLAVPPYRVSSRWASGLNSGPRSNHPPPSSSAAMPRREHLVGHRCLCARGLVVRPIGGFVSKIAFSWELDESGFSLGDAAVPGTETRDPGRASRARPNKTSHNFRGGLVPELRGCKL